MTPQLFRKEIETNFPGIEFSYNGFSAQTPPADNRNIAIVFDGNEWLFSGKNACHGYGKTLAEAVSDSAIRYQAWLDELGKRNAPVVTV